MMSEMEIRTARDEDMLELAQLKSRHVRMVYRGFLPHPLLAYAVPDSYQDQFRNWLHQDAFHLDVLVKNGTVQGYVVYGQEQAEPEFGLIQEAALDMACDGGNYRVLYDHALSALRAANFHQVHQWVLRDNFRLRFLLERFGFKADGTRRTVTFEGQQLQIARYLFRG